MGHWGWVKGHESDSGSDIRSRSRGEIMNICEALLTALSVAPAHRLLFIFRHNPCPGCKCNNSHRPQLYLKRCLSFWISLFVLQPRIWHKTRVNVLRFLLTCDSERLFFFHFSNISHNSDLKEYFVYIFFIYTKNNFFLKWHLNFGIESRHSQSINHKLQKNNWAFPRFININWQTTAVACLNLF